MNWVSFGVKTAVAFQRMTAHNGPVTLFKIMLSPRAARREWHLSAADGQERWKDDRLSYELYRQNASERLNQFFRFGAFAFFFSGPRQ
jgi:hypothetical protein